jgi:hypothetical protein
MAVFGPNNPGGRPGGIKNRLSRRIYEDVFRLWTEPPIAGGNISRGEEAMLAMYDERPTDFVRTVFSILPKDLVIESALGELSDEQIERTLETVRRLQEQADAEAAASDGDEANAEEADSEPESEPVE